MGARDLRVVGILLMLSVLAGCGYKGSLYLPGKEPAKKVAGQ
jgi:predicted small lipoprotein YifL